MFSFLKTKEQRRKEAIWKLEEEEAGLKATLKFWTDQRFIPSACEKHVARLAVIQYRLQILRNEVK